MKETTTKTTHSRRAIAIWVIQVVVAGFTSVLAWFRAISIPHCGMQCDSALLTGTSAAYFWVCVSIVCITGLGVAALRQRRWAWIIPAAGVLMILIGAVVATWATSLFASTESKDPVYPRHRLH